VPSGVGVIVGNNGKLGTVVSSARFKDEIKPMDKASETIHSLHPVTFRYKEELDPEGIPQFGLVAEQVEKVNPALVARDEQGKPYSARYDAVNAMLLNEFLKEHRKVEQQETTIPELKKELQATTMREQKQIEALAAGLQKVSAQLALSKAARQMAKNQ
jgi:endosialidase-like protein